MENFNYEFCTNSNSACASPATQFAFLITWNGLNPKAKARATYRNRIIPFI